MATNLTGRNQTPNNVAQSLKTTVLLLAVAALGYVGFSIVEHSLPFLKTAGVYALDSQMVFLPDDPMANPPPLARLQRRGQRKLGLQQSQRQSRLLRAILGNQCATHVDASLCSRCPVSLLAVNVRFRLAEKSPMGRELSVAKANSRATSGPQLSCLKPT